MRLNNKPHTILKKAFCIRMPFLMPDSFSERPDLFLKNEKEYLFLLL